VQIFGHRLRTDWSVHLNWARILQQHWNICNTCYYSPRPAMLFWLVQCLWCWWRTRCCQQHQTPPLWTRHSNNTVGRCTTPHSSLYITLIRTSTVTGGLAIRGWLGHWLRQDWAVTVLLDIHLSFSVCLWKWNGTVTSTVALWTWVTCVCCSECQTSQATDYQLKNNWNNPRTIACFVKHEMRITLLHRHHEICLLVQLCAVTVPVYTVLCIDCTWRGWVLWYTGAWQTWWICKKGVKLAMNEMLMKLSLINICFDKTQDAVCIISNNWVWLLILGKWCI